MFLPLVFYFLFSIKVLSADNVCGLEDVDKCLLTDTDCLEEFETALRSWYQTPEADGYFIKPIDPLTLDAIDFTVKHYKVTLMNVSITGLSESEIKIELSPPVTLKDTYAHNVILKASQYIVEDLYLGSANNFNDSVVIRLNDMKTFANVIAGPKPRCDGTLHLSLDPQTIHPFGGDAMVIEGFTSTDINTKSNEFITAITTTIAKISTHYIYRAQIQFTGEVLLSDIIITNPLGL